MAGRLAFRPESYNFMNMKPVLLLLFIIVAGRVAAQDTAARHSSQLIPKGGGWRLDGQTRKLSEQALKTTLYQVPAAIPYHKKFVTRRAVGFSLALPAIVFAALARRDPLNIKREFLAASMLCSGGIIYFTLSARKQQKRAVQLYNDAHR